MVDLLHLERHKNGEALGRKRSSRFDLIHPDGQRRVEAVHLLVFQHADLTHMLSAGSGDGIGIRVKLFLRFSRVHDGHNNLEHLLVAGGNILQKLTDLLALLFHIIRNNGSVIVVRVLLSLIVGDIGLDAERLSLAELLRFLCGYGNDVVVENHVAVAVRQLP